MTTYIVFLRGINVGGHRKVKMAMLREELILLGFQDVQTYIQSGNIVLKSEKSALDIQQIITAFFLEKYRFDVPVIVVTIPEIIQIIKNLPYTEEVLMNPKMVQVSFLSDMPEPEKTQAFHALEFPRTECYIGGKHIYINTPNGYSKTKLTNQFLERKLGVSATTRNWNTILKMQALTQEN